MESRERLEFVVTAEQAGKTVGHILRGEMKLGQRLVARLKRTENGICLNNVRVRTNVIVNEGDVVSAIVGDLRESNYFLPIECPLDIVYEDKDLIVVNKPNGMVVYAPNREDKAPTLGNALAFYLGEGALFHPVNRLDRGTTGLMVVAKNGYMHELLRRMLHSGEFYRTYMAVCCGVVEPAEGTIDLPIGRDTENRLKRIIDEAGKPAFTEYKRLEENGKYSLMELKPHTGRTHQLRLHMATLGYPLVGDWLYGEEVPELIDRPALHSAHLRLVHPVTGEELELSAPLPDDMRSLMK